MIKICRNKKSIFQALYGNIVHSFPVETFLTKCISRPILNRFSWPTDPLNLALHGSNEIICVCYWGFIPKVHFKLCLILLYIIEPSKWEHDQYYQCCIKYFQKVFQLQITKHILKMYFNYFCQLLWTRGPKHYILLIKVIEIQNTFRSHCESISQSINENSFNTQEKHKHILRLGIGTVTVTVQCMVNKQRH